jgi:hypothetical protein
MERTSALLERRSSRRGFLVRTAMVGAAFAAGPIRYLARPAAAWAETPTTCASGLCTDGYTEFCCTLLDGGNVCPKNTFIGGWWSARPPTSNRICGGRRRFYLDCNSYPGHSVPGGRHCARDDCNCRAAGWNRFSYFNCNTHLQHKGQLSYVVCRMVSCTNPCKIVGGPSPIADAKCRCAHKKDNATAMHDACCRCGECA